MKYIVMVPDGMADYPLEELGGRTPLEAAKIPNMAFMAKNGKVGLAATIPRGMTPASDVANLAILGYDPVKYYSGRGPLEAANMGIDLGKDDVAFRCNLVTEDNGVLRDYSAGHITSKEAEMLIGALDKELGSDMVKFYSGVSYRHLMVVKNARQRLGKISYMPPHDITGQVIEKNLPKGKGSDFLIELMRKSKAVLTGHEINKVRVDLKENPGNMIWLWGQGTKPALPSFEEKYGVAGSIISAVDLINGIGKLIGLDPIKVPGATGYYDTNYKGKGDYAAASLEHKDFVFIHVEASDEASHNKDIRAKIKAIENFDRYIVGTMLERFKGADGFRMMLLPDHATPISLGTHSSEPVPFVMYGSGIEPDGVMVFSETSAKSSRLRFSSGWELMNSFMAG